MLAFNPIKPYNDLPLLPPKGEIETRAVLRACIGARAAIAELKQAGRLVPNQAILINTIPMLESQASSEIENIVTTADRLFRLAQNVDAAAADPATKEALRYRMALAAGSRALASRPIATAMAVQICRTITGLDIDVRRLPGTALVNQATGETVYTPPAGEARLRDLLANWEQFVHATNELDPLVRMAIAHYQFEAIHPFTDGNGRTGRILNLLYLVECGLLELPVLYLSGAIIRRKEDYYRLLRGVSAERAWEPWILYMLECVEETAHWTTERILGIRALFLSTASRVRREAAGIYSRELVELVFVQPYCRIANLVDAEIAKRQTAAQYLKKLVDIGVLQEVREGRDKLFLNPGLLELLMSGDRLRELSP